MGGGVPVEIRRGALGKNGIPHVDDESKDFLVRWVRVCSRGLEFFVGEAFEVWGPGVGWEVDLY